MKLQPKPPTVLLLISSEGYYGVENMIVNLASGLSALGCRPILAVFRDSRACHTEIADHARSRGLTVELVPCSGRFDLRAVACLRSLIRSHQVDVIHSHGYKANLYAFAAAALSPARLVATCHNWLGTSWSMRGYAALDRLCLRFFDCITFVSERVSRTLRNSGIPARKLHKIPNGVDIERFDAASTLQPTALNDECLIGFVGRLVPEKGGVILLQAARTVLTQRPQTKFVLVGDGPARQSLQSLAADFGISDQVTFAGARNDMPAVYASFDLLVLPSLCEAMPMCVLEAMAAGKAVIATTVGSVPEVVDPEQTGILVEPGNVDSLAKALLRLIDSPRDRRRMGANGRIRATQHFSATAMSKTYLELYQRVVAVHKSGERTVPQIRTA